MPSYELTGPERVYPYARDANGRPLGTSQPGDIRFFDDGPPDSWWVPVIPPGNSETGSGDEGEARGGVESDPDPAGIPETPAPEPAAAPVPAPPAVVPAAGTAFAVTTDQQ